MKNNPKRSLYNTTDRRDAASWKMNPLTNYCDDDDNGDNNKNYYYY
jgi:hypothetical protein